MKIVKSILVIAAAVAIFSGVVTAEDKTGKDVFIANKCNSCHAVKSQGIETKAGDKYPDLSEVGKLGKDDAFLKKFLMKEETLNDKKHPIKFKGEDADFDMLVTWLNTLK